MKMYNDQGKCLEKTEETSDEEYQKLCDKGGYTYSKAEYDEKYGDQAEAEGEEEETEKSADPSEDVIDSLEKAMDYFQTVVAENDPDAEAKALFAKGARGELTDDEMARLIEIRCEDSEALNKSLFEADSAVIEYVGKSHKELTGAVQTLSKSQNELSKALASVLEQVAVRVDALSSKIDAVSTVVQADHSTPVAAPKSVQKSLPTQNEDDFRDLSKSDILKALTQMNRGNGELAGTLTKSIAKYETTSGISKSLARAVRQHIKKNKA